MKIFDIIITILLTAIFLMNIFLPISLANSITENETKEEIENNVINEENNEIVEDNIMLPEDNEIIEEDNIIIDENLEQDIIESDVKDNIIEEDIQNEINNELIENNTIEKEIQENEEILKQLNYLPKAYWDMIPKNCFYINDKFIFFDQEWEKDYLPVEFIIYRSVINSYDLVRRIDVEQLLQNMGLSQYKQCFEKLDQELRNEIIDKETFNKMYCKKITSIDNLINDKKIAQMCLEQEKEDNSRKQQYITELEEDNRKKQEYININNIYFNEALGKLVQDKDGNETEIQALHFIKNLEEISQFFESKGVKDMQFDVVIGNPPYQHNYGTPGKNAAKSFPIFHDFIEEAIKLKPKYFSFKGKKINIFSKNFTTKLLLFLNNKLYKEKLNKK